MNKALLTIPVLTLGLSACAFNQQEDQAAYATYTESCKETSKTEIAALFDRWNQSLNSRDAQRVVANYADSSILLPTASNQPRRTESEKLEYFQLFLADRPTAMIDMRTIELGCNTAVDSGLYTFNFARTGQSLSGRFTYTYRWDGSKWLITSHHSSAMPE